MLYSPVQYQPLYCNQCRRLYVDIVVVSLLIAYQLDILGANYTATPSLVVNPLIHHCMVTVSTGANCKLGSHLYV